MHRSRAVEPHSWWTSSGAGRRFFRPRPRAVAAAVLVLGMSALSACGSSATTGGGGSSSSPATSGSAGPVGASGNATVGISAVPAAAKVNYTNYSLYAKLYPNAYKNWTPPAGKVKYCESTFYLGNTYQQSEVTAFKQMVSQEAAAGRAQSGFLVENSNNATATQVSQVQSEIQSGCGVIFLDHGLDDGPLPAFPDRHSEARPGRIPLPARLQ